jgi:hypothetical protein
MAGCGCAPSRQAISPLLPSSAMIAASAERLRSSVVDGPPR